MLPIGQALWLKHLHTYVDFPPLQDPASTILSRSCSRFDEVASDTTPKVPWNKGKLLGSKPPVQTKQVWAIRTKLQIEHRLRDLAMFNLAIDSKLRGCDLVSLKVEDVAPHGFALERATVRQRKTGHPVKFEHTEQTREAIDAYMMRFEKNPGDFLFASLAMVRAASQPDNTRAYSQTGRQASDWTRESSAPTPCVGQKLP